jgi:aminoglycoside N3'-acetyltransferase
MRRVLRLVPGPVRREGRRLGTRGLRVLRRVSKPIRHDTLRAALDRATGGRAEILIVHSSLSSCGYFTAGADKVLDALVERCGVLCLPTHTYCYPVSPDAAGPVFDARTTPSQNGRLTEMFRARPGVTRSIHATHSLGVGGPIAAAVCDRHYTSDSPCGAGTPYDRLIQRRASALMFGVSFHYYTFFHTAEFMSGSADAFEHGTRDRLRFLDEAGIERERLSQRQSRAPMRFAEAGELMVRIGLARRVPLGRSALYFVPDASKAHDFLVERLKRVPDFLRQSCKSDLG